MRRKEEPLRNHPGIAKRYVFDEINNKWVHSGKYRAIRRIVENGKTKKLQAVFDNFEDAKAFRMGVLEKSAGGTNVHRLASDDPDQRYTFGALLEEWKSLHYLEIELTSQQMYEARIPHLQFLKNCDVDEIRTSTITSLVKHWASDEYPKPKDRLKFEKELDLLKVILNFYKRHKNHAYFVPILPDHYKAADIAKKARAPVRGLRQDDLGRFLAALKANYPEIYVLALLQIGLGLRVGETLALHWEDLDLDKGVANVRRNLAWDNAAQKHYLKLRKNKKELRVAIPALVIQELRAWKDKCDQSVALVFHRNGEFLRRQQIAKAYNRTLTSLNINYVKGTHMLRKTSGTLARKITGDVYAASKLLDHSSVSITEKYYQEELDEDKVMVANALNGVLVGYVGDAKNNSGESPPEEVREKSGVVPLCPPFSDCLDLNLVKSNT